MSKSAMKLDENMRLSHEVRDGVEWHSPLQGPFQITGFPWLEQEGVYRRLPVEPAHPIRDAVDSLANCTAGGQIRFRTNSPRLHLSVKLAAPSDMYHMPATGQSGFDCYIGGEGKQKYVSTTVFNPNASQYEATLFEGFDGVMRDITLNFPLYQGVEELMVGVAEEAEIAPPSPFASEGKLVFYGTSITQGGCAARPGMAYPNIIGRHLYRESVNLGFSGNGRGEPELAHLINEIKDLDILVLDYVPNVTIEEYRETLPTFIDIVRSVYPSLPILVVSSIKYAKDSFDPATRNKRILCRDFAKSVVSERQMAGDPAISFLNGDTMLGRRYDECTVDGVHPTDLGFQRIADAMIKVIKGILKE